MNLKSYFALLFLVPFFNNVFAQAEKIYGLNFSANELKLTSMDINTGEVEILSSEVLSPDIFAQGVSDFDPIEKRYFYVRGGNSNNTELFTVDALTGETISSPTLSQPGTGNTVSPITNIAYNWLDDELYGVNHQYNGNNTELRLSKVNTETGEVTIIANNPSSTTPFLIGNSDIDPVNRKYYYATTDKIYTVDLDSGLTVDNPNIQYPMSGNQFTANLTYDWQNDLLYCLHFLSVPNPDPFSDSLTSELRLSTIDPISGSMTLISQEITSNDGFSMGDCDIDPTGNRYFYVRQNELYIVSLFDGTVIAQIPVENQNNAVVPMINMSYDDLSSIPSGPIPMDMGESILLSPNETINVSAWVGDEAIYEWQDGNTDHNRTISEAGVYTVTINKDAFAIEGTLEVNATLSTEDDLKLNVDFVVAPNPASENILYTIESEKPLTGQVLLLDAFGRVLQTNNTLENTGSFSVKEMPSGTYSLQYREGDKLVSRNVLVVN